MKRQPILIRSRIASRYGNLVISRLRLKRSRITRKIGLAFGLGRTSTQVTPAAISRSSDYATPGLPLESLPNSDSGRDDKFYAVGSCFVRGLESALKMHKVAVESAAPEFARLQPAKKEISPLGFLNKYNTYSISNELRWALDPRAEFPRESIVQLTKTTWDDPHTTPILEFVDLEETLERRALIQTVTKRIKDCRAVIITLGLAEVWRDVKADVFLNRTPIPSLLKTEPDRYEFHLTGFAQNLANLEAIHALLTQYGHPDVHIVVTVSPIALMNTFSTMDIVVANTWAKSMLRAVAHEWAATHSNVDYYPTKRSCKTPIAPQYGRVI